MFLLKRNNLGEIPDKEKARHNLGIDFNNVKINDGSVKVSSFSLTSNASEGKILACANSSGDAYWIHNPMSSIIGENPSWGLCNLDFVVGEISSNVMDNFPTLEQIDVTQLNASLMNVSSEFKFSNNVRSLK